MAIARRSNERCANRFEKNIHLGYAIMIWVWLKKQKQKVKQSSGYHSAHHLLCQLIMQVTTCTNSSKHLLLRYVSRKLYYVFCNFYHQLIRLLENYKSTPENKDDFIVIQIRAVTILLLIFFFSVKFMGQNPTRVDTGGGRTPKSSNTGSGRSKRTRTKPKPAPTPTSETIDILPTFSLSFYLDIENEKGGKISGVLIISDDLLVEEKENGLYLCKYTPKQDSQSVSLKLSHNRYKSQEIRIPVEEIKNCSITTPKKVKLAPYTAKLKLPSSFSFDEIDIYDKNDGIKITPLVDKTDSSLAYLPLGKYRIRNIKPYKLSGILDYDLDMIQQEQTYIIPEEKIKKLIIYIENLLDSETVIIESAPKTTKIVDNKKEFQLSYDKDCIKYKIEIKKDNCIIYQKEIGLENFTLDNNFKYIVNIEREEKLPAEAISFSSDESFNLFTFQDGQKWEKAPNKSALVNCQGTLDVKLYRDFELKFLSSLEEGVACCLKLTEENKSEFLIIMYISKDEKKLNIILTKNGTITFFLSTPGRLRNSDKKHNIWLSLNISPVQKAISVKYTTAFDSEEYVLLPERKLDLYSCIITGLSFLPLDVNSQSYVKGKLNPAPFLLREIRFSRK